MLALGAPRAQTSTFERTFPAAAGARLDVSTHRGKITITAGDTDEVAVSGTVTARSGLNMPMNRGELAANVADHPPVRQQGATIELRPPADPLVDRATTIDYVVRVPPNTIIVAVSDSGDVSVTGVTGAVSVRTQSGAIAVAIGPTAAVTIDATTGSGSIDIDRSLGDFETSKGRAHGDIRGGGPLCQLTSKSGSIHVSSAR